MNPFASIKTFATHYRTQKLSPVDVTAMYLERIGNINPELNAFITVTAEYALDAAKRAEAELRHGYDRGLLHGIPVALKDLIDTKGVLTTCGSRQRAKHIPDNNAELVGRLEAAGAVCLGKTNLLEFAYGVVHPDFGPTRNPWNFERTAGGSSGGSAAAVAAGLCCAAIGTDTGGSIRIPASYCGVVGFKPSYGLVALAGVFPLSWSLDHAGPLARSSHDATIVLEALTGQTFPTKGTLAGLRLGIDPAYLEATVVEPAVLDAFTAAYERLGALGANIVEVRLSGLEQANQVLLDLLLPEASVIHGNFETYAEDYAPGTHRQLLSGLEVSAVTYLKAQGLQNNFKSRFEALFRSLEGILMPTAPWVAPAEDPNVTGDEGTAEMHFTGPFNLLGLPALSVPCGVSEGLPVGLQIATASGCDALALEVGALFEASGPITEQNVYEKYVS